MKWLALVVAAILCCAAAPGPSGTPWFSDVKVGSGATPWSMTAQQAAAALPAAKLGAAGGAATLDTNAAVPSAQLSNVPVTPALGQYGTLPRTVAARYSDELKVSDYGAKCDGTTDDWRAFQDALNVANGYVPVGVAGVLPTTVTNILNQLAANLSAWGAYGVTANSAAKIVVPAGRCVLSQALTVTLHANNVFSFVGAGSTLTELLFPNDTDGLVVNYPAGGVEAHSAAHPGAAVRIYGMSFVQADTGYKTAGRAIALIAPPVSAGNTALSLPTKIDDVEFHSLNGHDHSTQEWASDIYSSDVGSLILNDLALNHFDYSGGSEVDISFNSTQTAGFNANAPGNLYMHNVQVLGGLYGVRLTGNAIQGVLIESSPITAVGHCVNWIAPSLGFSAALHVLGSEMSCTRDGIATNFVSAVHISDNSIIDGQAIAGTNWCGICVDNTGNNGGSLVEDNVLANLPSTATLGSGYSSIGIRLTELPAATGGSYPSAILGNTVGATDVGIRIYGAKVEVGPNAVDIAQASGTSTPTCFSDITANTEPTQPVVSGLSCAGMAYSKSLAGFNVTGPFTLTGTQTVTGSQTVTSNSTIRGVLAAQGGFQPPLVAGVPTTAAPSITGSSTMVVDGADNKVCFYVSATWRCATIQ